MSNTLVACLVLLQSSLVIDLNQNPSNNPSSAPRNLVSAGPGVFFSALTPGLGRELWYTTGPSGTTALVVDGVLGPANGVPIDDSGFPVAFKGGLVYNAFEVNGNSLRFSDGTAAGTFVLANFHGTLPTEAAGFLYLMRDFTNLWRTDGTPAGTTGLPGYVPAGYSLMDMTASADGTLWLRVLGSASAGQLLRLPPGAAAPVAVANLSDFALEESLAALGNSVVMANSDAAHGRELWISDGTAAGTKLLLDLNPGPGSSNPSRMVSDGTYVWFMAADGAGAELWRTDGTAAGTMRLTDIWPGPIGSTPLGLTPFRGGVLFTATNPAFGSEPWISMANPGSATLVADVAAGGQSSSPGNYTVWNGWAYFSATTNQFVQGPFVTDGTPGGTAAFAPTQTVSITTPREFATYPGGVIFDLFAQSGGEPWSTNGTAAGTQLLLDIAPPTLNEGSNPRGFVGFEDRLVFGAEKGPGLGTGLYASDGSAAGTEMLLASVVGGSGAPRPLGLVGTRILFMASDPAHGYELWSTDGTASGTQLVKDLFPGASSSFPEAGLTFEGRLIFTANDGLFGREPWVSDGTPQGTFRIGDIAPGVSSSDPAGWTIGDNTLYFTAGPGPQFGFPTERRLICAVAPGTSSAQVLLNPTLLSPGEFKGTDIAYLDGHVYYEKIEPGFGIQFDAFTATKLSTGATSVVQYSTELYAKAKYAVVWKGRLHWIGKYPTKTTLFSCAAPSEPPLDLTGPNLGLAEDRLALTAGGLLFWGIQLDTAVFPPLQSAPQLYVSDGSSGGATPVFGAVGQGPEFVQGSSFFAAYGAAKSVVFQGQTPGQGVELWVSDGSAAGTRPLADVNPGAGPSGPTGPGLPVALRVGNRLFFAADDGSTGVELHVVPFAETTGDWAAMPFGYGCARAAGPIPTIAAGGSAALGQAFSVAVGNCPPNRPVLLLIGPTDVVAPLSGCSSYLGAPQLWGQATTDSNGAAALTFGVSNRPALVGFAFGLQWLVTDPLAGFGGLSDALEVVIGS